MDGSSRRSTEVDGGRGPSVFKMLVCVSVTYVSEDCAAGTHIDVFRERSGRASIAGGHQWNGQEPPSRLARPRRTRGRRGDRLATRLRPPGGAQPARLHLRRRPPGDGRRRCGRRAPAGKAGRLPLLRWRAGRMADAPSGGRRTDARPERPGPGSGGRTWRVAGTHRPALLGPRLGCRLRRSSAFPSGVDRPWWPPSAGGSQALRTAMPVETSPVRCPSPTECWSIKRLHPEFRPARCG
jgi:hypothetical protein